MVPFSYSKIEFFQLVRIKNDMQTRSRTIYMCNRLPVYVDERKVHRDSKAYYATLETLETNHQLSKSDRRILFNYLITTRMRYFVPESVGQDASLYVNYTD